MGNQGFFRHVMRVKERDDEANIDKVLRELATVPYPERTARFYCALAIALPIQTPVTVFGTFEG